MTTNAQILKSFKTSVTKGTPAWQAVNTVAKRWKVTPTRVFNAVKKEGWITSKPFNGENVFWWNFESKKNAQWKKQSETWFIQNAIEFAFAQGWATPEDFKGFTPRQIFAFLTPKFNAYFGQFKKTTAKRTTKAKTRKPTTRTRKTTTKSRKTTGIKFKGRTVKQQTSKPRRRVRKAA